MVGLFKAALLLISTLFPSEKKGQSGYLNIFDAPFSASS